MPLPPPLFKLYDSFSGNTVILIAIAIILFSGFLVTRITKLLRLPDVSGYILAGILIGPSVLHAIPDSILEGMGFVNDVALSFIAFGVSKFLRKEVLRQAHHSIFAIALLESLAAGTAVALAMRLFGMDWALAVLLGSIAIATAPSSTMMTINQYHARGPFVNALLQVVALDNMICLAVFSVAVAFVSAQGAPTWRMVLVPTLLNAAFPLAGAVGGWCLSRLLTPERSQENRLILCLATLIGLAGFCAIFSVSPLLSCMAFGVVYVNLTDDKALFKQINRFTPPIMSIFFIVSGMNLNLSLLASLGVVGVVYFLLRMIAKYVASEFGCRIFLYPTRIADNLGLALIPQAGVAIGLAFMAHQLLPGEVGDLLLTIVLASSVLYELVGPAAAKYALFRSGAIPRGAQKRPVGFQHSTIEYPLPNGAPPLLRFRLARTMRKRNGGHRKSASGGKEKKESETETGNHSETDGGGQA